MRTHAALMHKLKDRVVELTIMNLHIKIGRKFKEEVTKKSQLKGVKNKGEFKSKIHEGIQRLKTHGVHPKN
jgi:hypothetical protein